VGHKNIKIEPIDRLKGFLNYCDQLNKHPFVAKHKNGFKFKYTERFVFDESGADSIEANFDEIHLESLLTRVRQFISEKEMFHYEAVFKAVEMLFGHDQELKEFFTVLDKKLNQPFEAGNIQVIKMEKGSGKILIAGRTLKDLVEARLYSGQIHSERLIKPEPGSVIEDFSGNDKILSNHLNLELAGASLNTVGNIWRFRNNIILAARRTNKIDICRELEEVNERAKKNDL